MGDDFYTAYNFLSLVEGFDKGVHQNTGEDTVTYNGIYKKYWGDWEGWSYLDKGEIPPDYLTRHFYRENFWEHPKLQCDKLPSGINIMVFDFAVNAGVPQAAKTLQKVLGIKQDGWIGTNTLSLVGKRCNTHENTLELLTGLTRERIEFYFGLDNDNFENGWLNRTIKCDRVCYDKILPF